MTLSFSHKRFVLLWWPRLGLGAFIILWHTYPSSIKRRLYGRLCFARSSRKQTLRLWSWLTWRRNCALSVYYTCMSKGLSSMCTSLPKGHAFFLANNEDASNWVKKPLMLISKNIRHIHLGPPRVLLQYKVAIISIGLNDTHIDLMDRTCLNNAIWSL